MKISNLIVGCGKSFRGSLKVENLPQEYVLPISEFSKYPKYSIASSKRRSKKSVVGATAVHDTPQHISHNPIPTKCPSFVARIRPLYRFRQASEVLVTDPRSTTPPWNPTLIINKQHHGRSALWNAYNMTISSEMNEIVMSQTPPLLHGPSEKERKYDRQLRLWAASGQAALESANLLLVNSGAGVVGVEALKNLVLPGITIHPPQLCSSV